MFTYIDPSVRQRLVEAGKLFRIDRGGAGTISALGPIPMPLQIGDKHIDAQWYATVRNTELTKIEDFAAEGVPAVAVCFMHAYADGAHERAAEQLLREALPGAYLSVSSEVLPTIRFYDRVSTTVLNAYVGPVLREYLRRRTDGWRVLPAS